MAFSFIHVADLHLGSPLLGIRSRDPELAASLSAASRDAFTDLVDQAVLRKVDFFIIAGDVYDGEWKDTSIGLFFNRQISKLVRASILVYMIRGNHDARSVVTQSVRLPAGVFEFPSEHATTETLVGLKVAIHGRSFPARAVPENYAISYPKAIAGFFNIGILHTSCDGRAGGHDTYAPCSLNDLVSKGYQYWDLGHIHGYEELHTNPHVFFSGNLQGRGVHECGPKGALLITVDNDHVEVERLILDRARWFDMGISVEDCSTLDEMFGSIEEKVRRAIDTVETSSINRLLLIRIRLQGVSLLHKALLLDRQQLQDDIQADADQVLNAFDLASSIETISSSEGFREH